jgi:hypothetical protein
LPEGSLHYLGTLLARRLSPDGAHPLPWTRNMVQINIYSLKLKRQKNADYFSTDSSQYGKVQFTQSLFPVKIVCY